MEESELERKVAEASLYNDSQKNKPYNNDMIRCYATIAPEKVFGVRVNTALGYQAANENVSIPVHIIIGISVFYECVSVSVAVCNAGFARVTDEAVASERHQNAAR